MSEELDRLDKLAAEKVMGWGISDDGVYSDYKHCSSISDWTDGFIWWGPTRNIAQAWELLERLYHLVPFVYKRGDRWLAGFDNYIDGVEGETAPLAITKACLKAVGVECD